MPDDPLPVLDLSALSPDALVKLATVLALEGKRQAQRHCFNAHRRHAPGQILDTVWDELAGRPTLHAIQVLKAVARRLDEGRTTDRQHQVTQRTKLNAPKPPES